MYITSCSLTCSLTFSWTWPERRGEMLWIPQWEEYSQVWEDLTKFLSHNSLPIRRMAGGLCSFWSLRTSKHTICFGVALLQCIALPCPPSSLLSLAPPYLVLGIEEYFWRLNLSATPRGRFIPVSYCWHQLISTAETTLMALPERSNRNCKRFLENCIIKSHSQTTTQPHSWATTQSHSQVTSQHTLQGG